MKYKNLKKDSGKEKILGDVRIRADVVCAIILTALKEIDGIVKMGTTFAEGIKQILSKKNPYKGIKVDIINNQKTDIKILIVAEYGRNILQIANEIQEKVKKSVESMAGLSVRNINVEIQGLEIKPKKITK